MICVLWVRSADEQADWKEKIWSRQKCDLVNSSDSCSQLQRSECCRAIVDFSDGNTCECLVWRAEEFETPNIPSKQKDDCWLIRGFFMCADSAGSSPSGLLIFGKKLGYFLTKLPDGFRWGTHEWKRLVSFIHRKIPPIDDWMKFPTETEVDRQWN
jgi:hypothetical protein